MIRELSLYDMVRLWTERKPLADSVWVKALIRESASLRTKRQLFCEESGPWQVNSAIRLKRSPNGRPVRGEA